MSEIKKLVINGSTYQITDDNAVSFGSPQTLTGTQKEQARNNIAAAGKDELQREIDAIDEVLGNCVKVTPQTIAEEKKAQARQNIGAASAKDAALYYAKFFMAIDDINDGLDIGADPSGPVKVFTGDNGVTTIMLLDDVDVDEVIDINKDIVLVLNGHVIHFTEAGAQLNFHANCIIDGEVAGSGLVKEEADGEAPVLIFVDGSSLRITGGRYSMSGSYTGQQIAIKAMASCEHVELDNCTLVVENTNTSSTNAGVAKCIQYIGENLIAKNSEFNARSETGVATAIHTFGIEAENIEIDASSGSICNGIQFGISAADSRTSAILDQVTIKATALSNTACGIIGNNCAITIKNSSVFADAPGDSVDDAGGSATGIVAYAPTVCINTDVTGTLANITSHSDLYVKGGTLTAHSHGLYMVNGAGSKVYVKDAVLRNGVYTGQFPNKQDSKLAMFYIGDHDNFATYGDVYIDGCTFEGSANELFVVRPGPDAVHKNRLFISNITNNAVNATTGDPLKWIRLNHNADFNEYLGAEMEIGVGCDFTPENTSHPECAKVTGKLYRKTPGNISLNGDDWDALAELRERHFDSATQLRNKTRRVTPLVTFMDDDGPVEVMTKLKPISEQYKIPFVAAIITNTLVPEDTAHLNVEDVLELQAMGWEIASHTMSHPNLGSLTDEQQETELAGSKQALEGIGIKCDIIAYPGSNTNENTWRIAQKYYRAGRQTDWKDHLNNSPLETWDLRVVEGFDAVSGFSDYPSDTDPLVYCKAMVDKAVTEKGWVIFLSHAEELTETGLSNLRETIEYVQSLNIPIVTMSEALDIRGNMIDIGRYNRKIQREYPNIYDEHFTVGCDGSLAQKDNDKYLVYLTQNAVTSATPPKDFPRYAISSCRITYANTSGFPSADGGTLLTNTLGSSAYDYSEGRTWQELILPNSHISWKRYALSDTEWSEWSDDGYMLLAEDSMTVDSLPTAFPKYMRSKVYMVTGPDNVAGWLITDRTGHSGAFTTQVFVPLNFWRSNGGMFYRAADSNTQWGAWTCLGERVTSNANFITSATSLKYPGACVFDTTRGKPVWYNGTNWVDATGTVVV